MESKYLNYHVPKIKLFYYKDIAELHYKILNIFLLLCYNSDYYCFCDKYQVCEKVCHIERDLCQLCYIFDRLRYIFVMILYILKTT